MYFGVHPKWSPMAVKSAIMDHGSRVKTADGKVSRDYYAQGAGNVRPDRCSPRSNLRRRERDWWGFLEGQGFATDSELRQPIRALQRAVDCDRQLAGSQTVQEGHRVKPGSYQTTISVPS